MKTEDKQVQIKRKKRKKKTSFLGYVYLFILVFVVTLFALSFFVKSYSPDVDVTIGNNETMTLSESDMEVEMKSVDERLKWIQMEDEMPSVAIREAKESTEKSIKGKKEKKEENNKKIIDLPTNDEPIFKKEEVAEIPKPNIAEIKTQTAPQIIPQPKDLRSATALPIIPAPIPTLTKIYLGSYSTIDEAMSIQQKIATDIPEAMPFIKSYNGGYIVQLGSFSNKAIADNFIQKVKEKGYNPQIMN